MAQKTLKDFFVRVQTEALAIHKGPLGVNRHLVAGNENMKEYEDALKASVDMALDACIAQLSGVEQ